MQNQKVSVSTVLQSLRTLEDTRDREFFVSSVSGAQGPGDTRDREFLVLRVSETLALAAKNVSPVILSENNLGSDTNFREQLLKKTRHDRTHDCRHDCRPDCRQ